MSERLHLFSKDTLALLAFIELGRTGKLGVSIHRSPKRFTVRIGKHIRVSAATLVECQSAIPAAIDNLSAKLK